MSRSKSHMTIRNDTLSYPPGGVLVMTEIMLDPMICVGDLPDFGIAVLVPQSKRPQISQ